MSLAFTASNLRLLCLVQGLGFDLRVSLGLRVLGLFRV